MTIPELLKQLMDLNKQIPLQANTEEQIAMVQIKGAICAIIACYQEGLLADLILHINPLATKLLLEKLQKAQNSYKNN